MNSNYECIKIFQQSKFIRKVGYDTGLFMPEYVELNLVSRQDEFNPYLKKAEIDVQWMIFEKKNKKKHGCCHAF